MTAEAPAITIIRVRRPPGDDEARAHREAPRDGWAAWYTYCPSSGTEGYDFIDRWCGTCIRERRFRELEAAGRDPDGTDGCHILNRSFLGRGDPDYPTEWRIRWFYRNGAPHSAEAECTAWVEDRDDVDLAHMLSPEEEAAQGRLFD